MREKSLKSGSTGLYGKGNHVAKYGNYLSFIIFCHHHLFLVFMFDLPLQRDCRGYRTKLAIEKNQTIDSNGILRFLPYDKMSFYRTIK